MNRTEAFNQIQEIARNVFKDKNLQLKENTTLDDIGGWNSLTHIMFIDTIEKTFKIQFSFEDMLTISDIKAICDVIEKQQECK
jgi:acyl carrier protein